MGATIGHDPQLQPLSHAISRKALLKREARIAAAAAARNIGRCMQQPIHILRDILDARLNWVQDKPLGPEQNSTGDVSVSSVGLVRSGMATIETEQGQWRAAPGEFLVMQPGVRQYRFDRGTQIWSVGFYRNRQPSGAWLAAPMVLVLREAPTLVTATRALQATVESATGVAPLGDMHLWKQQCTLADWLRIEAQFRSWLAILVETLLAAGYDPSGPVIDPRVRAVRNLIQEDPWSDASAPQALAEAVGLTKRRLEQLFAAQVGHGVAEERNRQRLASASRLLRQPELNMKQIARRLGFASTSAFSAWFRRGAGVSPTAARRSGALVG